MTPLDQIRAWLDSLGPNLKQEIATLIVPMLADCDPSLLRNPQALPEWLDDWLRDTTFGPRVKGKAVSFVAVIEAACWNRWSEEGHERTAQFWEGIIGDAPEDRSSEDTELAEDQLRKLEFRQKQWQKVREAWVQLRDTHLAREALDL